MTNPQVQDDVVSAPPEALGATRSLGSAILPSLRIERLTVHDLRNLAAVELQPGARLNVLSGHNAQGKTSVLEAIYLLATSRSFRTSKLGELVRHGAPAAVTRGSFIEQGLDRRSIRREQSCAVERSKGILRLDGEPPASSAEYATRSPVVVFDPQQLTLTSGAASGRRTLLDRTSLFLVPRYGADRAQYRQALAARQALLAAGSSGSARSRELDVFETLLASHGARVTDARELASRELERRVIDAYQAFGAPGRALAVRYRPGGCADVEQARRQLAANRVADARRRRANFGPHLDELEITLDGRLLRAVGSQGQHRAVTLALKLGELRCIASARALEPVLLLDDVSSELDEQRAQALFAHLATTPSQIFLTTTRPDLIVAPALEGAERQDYELRDGVVRAR